MCWDRVGLGLGFKRGRQRLTVAQEDDGGVLLRSGDDGREPRRGRPQCDVLAQVEGRRGRQQRHKKAGAEHFVRPAIRTTHLRASVPNGQGRQASGQNYDSVVRWSALPRDSDRPSPNPHPNRSDRDCMSAPGQALSALANLLPCTHLAPPLRAQAPRRATPTTSGGWYPRPRHVTPARPHFGTLARRRSRDCPHTTSTALRSPLRTGCAMT